MKKMLLIGLSILITVDVFAASELIYTCVPGPQSTSRIINVYSTKIKNQYNVEVIQSISAYEKNEFVIKNQTVHIVMEKTNLIDVDEAGLRPSSIDPHYDLVLAAADGSILAMDSKNVSKLTGRASVLRQVHSGIGYDNKFLCMSTKK